MAWSPAFQAWLDSDLRYPVFVVDKLQNWWFDASKRTGAGRFRVSSHPLDNSSYLPVLVPRQSSFTSGALQYRTWRRGYDSLIVAIQPTFDPRRVLPRGEIVQLRVGWQGQSVADLTRAWFGQVRNIRRGPSAWLIECTDIRASLLGPLTTDGTPRELFAAASTTVNEPGGVTIDTAPWTLTVDNAAQFRGEIGGRIYLRTEDSDGVTRYFAASTSTSGATNLEIIENDPFEPTTSTSTTVPDGVGVTLVNTIKGTPVDIVHKVLTSQTGDQSNNNRDTLPVGWGLGIRASLLDLADGEAFQTLAANTQWGRTGQHRFLPRSESSQPNALGWLESVTQAYGLFLAIYRGRLAARIAIPPTLGITTQPFAIDDHDIVEILEHSVWDPQAPYEVASVAIKDGQGTTIGSHAPSTGRIDSRPAFSTEEIEQIDVWENATETGAAIAQRMYEFWAKVPERVRLTLRGLKAANLAAGDLVALSTRHLSTRRAVPFQAQICLVMQCTPNWFGATSVVDLAFINPDPSEVVGG